MTGYRRASGWCLVVFHFCSLHGVGIYWAALLCGRSEFPQMKHHAVRRIRLRWGLMISLALSLACKFEVVVSQNANFTFSTFENIEDLELLGDAQSYTNSIFLNAVGTAAFRNMKGTCGQVMFKDSVRLLERDTSNNKTKVASFSTAFTFFMSRRMRPSCKGAGDGLVFLFSRNNIPQGDAGGSLCAIREADDTKITNHMFSVEFDTYRNVNAPQFDISNNHVGVNVNSLKSVQIYNLCENLTISSSNTVSNCTYLVTDQDFTAWIDFYGENRTLEVRLASGSLTSATVTRPADPLMDAFPLPDIDDVFLEYMYVGFAGSVYSCKTVTTLKSWTFRSSGMPNLPPVSESSDATTTSDCRHSNHIAVIAGVSAASGSFLAAILIAALGWCFVCGKRRHSTAAFEKTLFWPRKFTYKELSTATNNFSVEQLLGSGGFGEVYKGTLCDNDDSHMVAVKRMKHDSKQGEREFSAEISVISQIRHRNLVQILGWCREHNQLMLVYEYMPNSSLDVWLFDPLKGARLTWNLRFNILRGLAVALAYLHEEWEQCIVHRDIKASNVMLDKEFNAHLGDFGLARLIDHDSMPKSTTLAGTLGYLAPELPHTRKATKQSDVYSYGVLALEIACGRPVYDDRASAEEKFLQDLVWEAHEGENILSVADTRLHNFFDTFEMNLVLSLGLLCTHPEPHSRPTMRFVHQCIIGDASVAPLPSSRPDLQCYSLQGRPLGEFGSW